MTPITYRYDKSILLLSFTDQRNWGLNRFCGKILNCSTDVDENWFPVLCKLFREAVKLDINKTANSVGPYAANKEIIKVAKHVRPDYVLYPCNFSGLILPSTLRQLRLMGSIIVSYFFDDDVYFDSYSQHMIPFTDYCVTHAPNMVKRYEELGARVIYATNVPMSASIFKNTHYRKVYDVSFIGGLFFNRREMIQGIRDCGINVNVFDTSQYNSKLHYTDYVKIINQSKISLNFSFNNNNGHQIRQIKGRPFEVCLCGGFLLSEIADGLQNLFVAGQEIETFDTPREAADKIRYYLANEEERNRIAENGHRRAMADYIDTVVVSKTFDIIVNRGMDARRIIALRTGDQPNELEKLTADTFMKFAKAMLFSFPPARGAWVRNAVVARRLNPNCPAANKLLKTYRSLGDPAPIRCVSLILLSFIMHNLIKIKRKYEKLSARK